MIAKLFQRREILSPVFEKIIQTGGFLDLGKIGSMPLGYYKNGQVMNTDEYHEAMILISNKKLKKSGLRMSNKLFKNHLTNTIIEGDVYIAK